MANIYLKSIGGDYSVTDPNGSGNSNIIPKVVRTLSDTLHVEFFNEDGTDMTLPVCSSFVFAADVDYLTNTAPPILTNSGITQSGNVVSIPINTNTAELATAMIGKPSLPLTGEIKGFALINAVPVPILIAQFKLNIVNVIYDGGTEPSENPSDYYTAAQVDAIIAAGDEVEFSVDGLTDWHSEQDIDNDRYMRSRNREINGAWSDVVGLIQGTKGDKGDAATIEAGAVTTLAAGASATVTNTGNSSAAVFAFGIPQGGKGDKGDSAYQVWLDEGNTGTVADYLVALKGDDGTGLNIRGAYSSEATYTSSATVRDAVQDQGCLWGCLVETTTGNAPPTYPTTSNTQWVLLVAKGDDGTDGDNGATFTPAVAENGDLSWTNDGGLSNPTTVNLIGPQGIAGQFENGVPDYEFDNDDLVNGVLVRTFAQLGIVAAAPVQVYDNSGVLITDDSAVVLSWTGTGISVDVSAIDPIAGTWVLRFAGGTKQIVRDFEMTTLEGEYTPDFADGDFQRGTLTDDMEILPPTTIDASGLAMCIEVTCGAFTLTVGSDTYTGMTVLVTFYRSGASVRYHVAEVNV